MDCFQDCCLFCDRNAPDGAYCSQQCKLADHERANASNPSSPSSPTSTSTSSGQWLPSRPQSTYFGSDASQQLYYHAQSAAERHLTPSSSRTSLSSTISSSTGSPPAGLSAQAKQDLQGFFSSFDQARAAKRRSSLR